MVKWCRICYEAVDCIYQMRVGPEVGIVIHTETGQLIPYSRKLSRVKTFANSIKQGILRIKLSRFAEAHTLS